MGFLLKSNPALGFILEYSPRMGVLNFFFSEHFKIFVKTLIASIKCFLVALLPVNLDVHELDLFRETIHHIVIVTELILQPLNCSFKISVALFEVVYFDFVVTTDVSELPVFLVC